MHLGAVFLAEPGGVFVGGGAAGELFDTGLGIDRYVLPMPISADDIHVVLRGDEGADLVTFVSEALVGMVVVLVAAIRTDDGCGANEDPECGVG